MEDKTFIFLAGLHRSGTSLLHEVMRDHPQITGFEGTSAPHDEGQHLQSVFKPAKAFGGPGKFVFDPRSYMDETHELATPEHARTIYADWCLHLDPARAYVIEKSPPNLVRTRYLQKIFPGSRFIVILRHPLAVAYATKKWAKTPIPSLLDHTLKAYEIFAADLPRLDSAYVLHYEDFVGAPQATVDAIFAHLGLPTITVTHKVRTDINDKYFKMWERDRRNPLERLFHKVPADYEARANRFGYSLDRYREPVPTTLLGAHAGATA